MRALVGDRKKVKLPNLQSWLRHGDLGIDRLRSGDTLNSKLTEHNQLSQLNVLIQMEHVKTYPAVRKRIEAGTLDVHGLWFDIAKADVYAYEEEMKRFVLIDETEAERLLKRLEK